MPDWDDALTKNLLLSMEKEGYPFEGYHLKIMDQEPVCLGRGSYSRVYEAWADQGVDRRYALKVIGLENGKVSSEKFYHTTWLQGLLGERSRNIVRIIGVKEILVFCDAKGALQRIEEFDGKNNEKIPKESILLQFLLMEALEGLIEKDKFWNCHLLRTELSREEEILQFGLQIGHAILTAHQNRVLHRDIKLENIFWNERQHCYQLGDFGIARLVENGSAETVVYTDGYGAPEIERRLLDHYDVTADIYSFGICLYLLFNELRFPGADGYIAVPVQYDPEFVFPAPVHGNPEIARFLRKACSYEPEDRFQSMEEMLGKLLGLFPERDAQGDDVGKEEREIEETLKAVSNVVMDLETETYREDEGETAEDHSGNGKDAQKKASGNRKEELGESEGSESTAVLRAERKRELERKGYRAFGFTMGYIAVFSFLVFLFLLGLPDGAPENLDWRFWIFPIMVLAESVLLTVGEFHVLFGIVTAGAGIYFMGRFGINLEYCLLFASLLCMSPIYSFPCSIGVLLWGLARAFGTPGGLAWIGVHDLNWIPMAVMFYMIRLSFLHYRMTMEEVDFYEVQVGQKPWDLAGSLLILIGLFFFVLEFAGICVRPELVVRLHLIPAGILVYAMRYVSKWISSYF